MLNRFQQFLFKEVDIAALAFFRIILGILLFADVFAIFFIDKIPEDILAPAFNFTYWGFEWVRPLPSPWIYIFFGVLALLGLFIAAGFYYRISATLYAFGFSYYFLLEKAYYLNHGYLLCVLCFLIIFMPLHRKWSYDAWRDPGIERDFVANWSLFLLQFCMGIVYFFGGIAKMNMDWIQGFPLKMWLYAKRDYFVIGPLLEQEWFAMFMSWGGLFFDLFIVFFLINKKSRHWAFLLVVAFHFLNLLIFQIGVFPFLSVILSSLFFNTDYPRKILNYFKKYNYSGYTALPGNSFSPLSKKIITFCILIFIIYNITMPLRHHLYPNHVAWTEDGHRYAWRMMLRGKTGVGNFYVKDLDTNKEWRVNYRDYISKRQRRKMLTHPDMILQYAHFLKKEYIKKGHKNVSVRAEIRCKLNGRKYQEYTFFDQDLTQFEEGFWTPSEWIVPFENTEIIWEKPKRRKKD